MNASLIITSLNPNIIWLKQMLDSAIGAGFDEIMFHIDADTLALPDIDFSKYPELQVWDYYEHLSVEAALNFMISFARNPWICCFACDDYFHRDNLKTLFSFPDYKADIIHFPVGVVVNDGYSHLWGNNPDFSYDDLKQDNKLPFGSFFRKQVWERVGGFEHGTISDWNFWLKAKKAGFRFSYHMEIIYYFRMGHDCWTNQLIKKFGITELRRRTVADADAYQPPDYIRQ